MNKRNIVVSTGAGISAESGVPTFRDIEGLWTKYDPGEVAHINGWKKDPQKLIDFKNMLRQQFIDLNPQPNAAHIALTKLQNEWKHGEVSIVTQNIDGLHALAGSKAFCIHGDITKKYCEKCGNQTDYDTDIVLSDSCIECGAVSSIRPMTVMFGEMPCFLDIVDDKLNDCSIFAAIGTSLEVMPASLFGKAACLQGAETWLINKEPPSCGLEDFTHVIYGSASVEVPNWVDLILNLP